MRRIAQVICACLLIGAAGCQKKQVPTGDPLAEWARCQELSEKKRFEEAAECFEVFKSRYPLSAQGIEADLEIGDNYFRKKDFLLAAEAYKNFIKLHPTHPKLDYATFRTGLALLREAPKAIDRDQEHLEEAIQYLREAYFLFPESPYRLVIEEKLVEARNRQAARHLYVGRFYYKTKEYLAALPRFQTVLDEYADSPLVPQAYFYLIRSHLALDHKPEARHFYERFRMGHAEHNLTKRIGQRFQGAL